MTLRKHWAAGVCFNQTLCLLAGASIISSTKRGEGGGRTTGIATLFHGVSRVSHAISHIGRTRRDAHTSAHVPTPHGWVEKGRCFISQVTAVQTPPPRVQHISTQSLLLVSSLCPLRPEHSLPLHLSLSFSLRAAIHILSCLSFFLLSIFLLTSFLRFIYPWSSRLHIFLYKVDWFAARPYLL